MTAVMVAQLAGLLASIVLYCAALWAFLAAQARTIRALPPDWREHPELREGYEAALNLGMRSFLTWPRGAALGWTAGFVVTFAALAVGDFTLKLELIYAAVLALVWTGGGMAEAKAEGRRLGLSRPGTRETRALAVWACWFLVWLGYLGAACFAGGLLATPLD
jgi:hypothetical protein